MTDLFVTKTKTSTGYGLLPAHQEDLDAIKKLPNGQPLRVKLTRVRNGQFHRKWWALVNYAFDIWEPPVALAMHELEDGQFDPDLAQPTKSMERFRKDIIILCGFYEQHWRIDGTLRIEPQSISFAKMDEDEFETLYTKTIDVICKHVLTNYSGDELRRVMAEIEEFE